MHLVMRGIRFLALSALAVLLRLARAVLQLVLLPILFWLLHLLWSIVSMSFTATINGPGQYVNNLAAEWTQRLLEVTGGREYIDQIFSLCRLLVGSTIVLGWIISIVFTVEILRVVFGLFI